ncbi:DctP family TRAP transporter solute-binding subunit [Alteribacillus sp. YIM 98480]|uniref:DctP family TRAP transporter solute-binding subunit n=1 Tax=Alteribacillus sp. YIM 98480 TaxID=2606599 RepID=UPI00131D61CF|nr:DctP family TRAP transporter solute-binding subunit [Alteribacillus sp. YIM 98480]
MKNLITIAAFVVIGLMTSLYIGFGYEENQNIAAEDEEVKGLNEKVTLKFSYVTAENTPKGKAARYFAQAVKEKTNGWVEVEVYPNGMLYEAQEEFEALRNNQVHFIAPAFSEIAVRDNKWMVMDFPFAFENERMVKEAFQGKIGELLFESIETSHYKGLAFWENGFKHITNNIRPITDPKDLKGLTMRVMPSKVLSETYHKVDANPKTYPFNSVYSLLSDGKIDGTENTLSNIYSKGFYEQQRYMTISRHNYLGYAVLTNKSMWNRLPVEHQQAIEDAMDETTEWLRTHAKDINNEMLERMKTQNVMEIHELTAEEKEKWKKTFTPVYKQYEENIGQELIKELKKLQKKYDIS